LSGLLYGRGIDDLVNLFMPENFDRFGNNNVVNFTILLNVAMKLKEVIYQRCLAIKLGKTGLSFVVE
jgi:hypothetical protein